MPNKQMPYQIINTLAAGYAPLSDTEVLAALTAIPPLADESDSCWDDGEYWYKVAYPYLALWDAAAGRKLRAAVPLILDRACFGDPGEIMRNLCHTVEAIVNPDWEVLTAFCIEALSSPRPGTRFWAAAEMGRLRDPAAIPALEQAADDVIPDVRREVESALDSIGA